MVKRSAALPAKGMKASKSGIPIVDKRNRSRFNSFGSVCLLPFVLKQWSGYIRISIEKKTSCSRNITGLQRHYAL